MLVLLSHCPHIAMLPQMPVHLRIRAAERVLALSYLFAASATGTLREVLCVSSAAAVIPLRTSGGSTYAPVLALAWRWR